MRLESVVTQMQNLNQNMNQGNAYLFPFVNNKNQNKVEKSRWNVNRSKSKINLFSFCLFFLAINIFSAIGVLAQNIVSGKIVDESGKALSDITIAIPQSTIGTYSDGNGMYELNVGDKQTVRVEYSGIGFERQSIVVSFYNANRMVRDIVLKEETTDIEGVEIKAERDPSAGNITRLDGLQIERLPSVSGGVEAILKTLPGVAANNELSSQYSVRGGNFDENLIYVNDFQIYRPFLVRSGQQEGLSFVNSDLVQSIAFSAGGFEAKYGDKLSSVLDIKYKIPRELKGSAEVSLLGVNAHLEGRGKNKNLTYVMGVRQRRNRYLFNTLSSGGNYDPLFLDFQSFLTYNINSNWQMQLISNYTKNRYYFEPEIFKERIGNLLNTLQIRAAFEGQERDTYNSFMSGLGGVYTSDDNKMVLKFLSSIYTTSEIESFDIIGEYFLGEVESDLGEESFGDIVRESGIGTYHNWARNNLEATIANVAHRGYLDHNKHYFNWGLKYQIEDIKDHINEWNRVDSAGYSLSSLNDLGVYSAGYNSDSVTLFRVLRSDFDLQSHRINGYVQDTWTTGEKSELSLTGGARFGYWTANNEFFVSPRFQMGWRPFREHAKDSTDLAFRLATGLYYQPPFYREMRNQQGEVNTELKSQKSFHFITGMDYEFNWWGRPFKFTSEAYFKWMWDLVPYDLDNVLIRYYGQNRAKGYAYGADFRLNGEFVKGTESWFSLSFLQTQEELENDGFVKFYNQDSIRITPGQDSIAYTVEGELGWVRRPTNQLANFAIFFQDNFPGKENFKMNLNFVVATPLPFGPPNQLEFRNRFLSPPYIRADIGFSALLFERGKREIAETSVLNNLESMWFAIEVFNLLDIKNTISYSWLSDLNGIYYAVPNRLTTRLINARLIVKF